MLSRLTRLPLIVVLLGATGLGCWIPAGHALVMRDLPTSRAFFYSGLIVLVLTILIGLATASRRPRNAANSHLSALVAAYVILPVVMAFPFLQAVPATSFANAWFEMLSSFTTTGAAGYEPARLPQSVHLWRALVGWFGGFFILLAAYAILAPLNLGGTEVISGRFPGGGARGISQIARVAEPSERLSRYSLQIFPVYSGLTLLLWLGLLIVGEPGLTALTHAMGTLSTSGISAGQGPDETPVLFLDEVLILIFLIFAVTRRALPFARLADRSRRFSRDPELRTAVVVVVLVPLVLLMHHWIFALGGASGIDILNGVGSTLWGALFTSASFLTTTGYESAHWGQAQLWSGLKAPGMMLMGLAMLGGGVATTAGGVKLLRIYALFRQAERELERVVHPSSIGGKGAAARKLRREGAYMAWVFFMLFSICIAGTILVLSMAGMDFQSALVLTVAALTNTGPLADVALSQPIPYGPLSLQVKMILGGAMIVGRLEVLALIALLAPGGWRH